MATQIKSAISLSDKSGQGYDYTFSTLTTWEADPDACPDDLVTPDVQAIADCFNDWPTTGLDDDPVISSDHITSATANIIVQTPLTERHDGTGLPHQTTFSGFKLNASDTGILFNIRANYTEVIGLGVRNNYSYSAGRSVGIYGDFVKFSKCIVQRSGDGNAIDYNADNVGIKIFNNVVRAGAGACLYGSGKSAANPNACYNNTVVGNNSATTGFNGITTFNLEYQIKNNVLLDMTTEFANISNSMGSKIENNATEGSSFAGFAGAGTVTNVSVADGVNFTAPSVWDYSLTPTSVVIDEGIDLSAEGFNDDIIGTARGSAWDISAYEYSTGEPPTTGKIYLGGTEITSMKLGVTDIPRAYLGDTQVFGN